ncbi:diaminopimelate decarboxylase family protein [Campylobacter canadensis]|uniref:Alanine racemase n=1 Tax=Campylobacter canadensis TaxID=449520 RepID=A0ABS7WTB5_9BACT|nr:alanine racemase [Campylobacter canadensis]MBZ7988030.1 alanine racemase [Campylobacter canadensis]MBZ7998993.1 alanine racemase [Campylobacter canadensis]
MQIIANYEELRQDLLSNDRRFSCVNEHLAFFGVDLVELSNKYPSPAYVYSKEEISNNINEIKQAFKEHKTRIFYASKACSVMGILKCIKDNSIDIEANSIYEVKKALKIGFKPEQIIFNGVVKSKEELEFAIENDLFLINVDSEYELDLIEQISTKLKKVANLALRIEPSVKAKGTHEQLDTSFHAKAGVDKEQALALCKRMLNIPYVKLKGLHMHVGDQLPIVEPFANAAKVLVDECIKIQNALNIKFELINVGGGISTAYKYEKDNIKTKQENMKIHFNANDYAKAIINEVKRLGDITICIEPGRKIVSSAGILLSKIAAYKQKTLHPLTKDDKAIQIEWKFLNAGYSILSDSQHFDWFYYVYNASKITKKHDTSFRLAGPLCDGGDWFKIGTNSNKEFLLPKDSNIDDLIVFLDAGAYTIESQTTYNNRPRSAVILIDENKNDFLIRREDSFDDILSCDIY